jgi:hypothetical protein
MGKSFDIKLNGMNNRAKITALPGPTRENPFGKYRNAENVVFDNAGQLVFPCPGKTLVYAGNVSWVHEGKFVTVFLEDGILKRLNSDNTATTLKTGFGTALPAVTYAGDVMYISNGTGRGKVDRNGNYYPWGTPRPPRNPDVTAVTYGGMYEGRYRVAITWIGAQGDESGCGNGKQVEVSEGGGIHLTNFPSPPSGVDKVAVHVTSVNGKDLYLYGEYDATLSDITLTRKDCTIPLMTQFSYVPMPEDIICFHYGRIYYPRGRYLYWTMTRRLGNQTVRSYWTFDSNVTLVVSVPGALYVGTEKRIWRVSNIDVDGAAAVMDIVKECGCDKATAVYDDEKTAFFKTHRGYVRATSEGLFELTFDDVAMPIFERGSTTLIDHDGSRYLVGVFQNGTQNELADAAYSAAELARGSL